MFKYEDLLFTVVWVLVAVGFGAGLALVCNRFDDPRCQRRAFRFALWSILAVFVLASAGLERGAPLPLRRRGQAFVHTSPRGLVIIAESREPQHYPNPRQDPRRMSNVYSCFLFKTMGPWGEP